jgi:hypothetical protein
MTYGLGHQVIRFFFALWAWLRILPFDYLMKLWPMNQMFCGLLGDRERRRSSKMDATAAILEFSRSDYSVRLIGGDRRKVPFNDQRHRLSKMAVVCVR